MIFTELRLRKRMMYVPNGQSPGNECRPADLIEITCSSFWCLYRNTSCWCHSQWPHRGWKTFPEVPWAHLHHVLCSYIKRKSHLGKDCWASTHGPLIWIIIWYYNILVQQEGGHFLKDVSIWDITVSVR